MTSRTMRSFSPGWRASVRQMGRGQGRRGASLVEFAIVLPVLVMVLFSVWEFGRIFGAWQISTNAAREGARYAMEWSPADGDMTAYVKSKVMNYVITGYGARLNPVGGDVTIENGDITVTSTPGGGPVTVTVAAHIDIWAPAVAPLMGGSTFTVNAWSTMRQ